MPRFLSDHYDVGIIPCTSKKRPEGATPVSLYMGTTFSLMMRHAQQRCETVLVLSARYGLLRLTDPVAYYDQHLERLTSQERAALIYRISAKPWVDLYAGKRILSYLPNAYFDVLAEAKPALAATIRRPYRSVFNNPTIRELLSWEIKNYGKNPAVR